MVFVAGVGFILVGFVFAAGVVCPNDFCGVRLPWTLADEVVWDKTNRRCGELFMMWGGGLATGGWFELRIEPLAAIVVPGLFVLSFATLWAILEYHGRHGALGVSSGLRCRKQEGYSFLPDVFVFLIPLVGLVVTFRLLPFLPARIPIRYSLSGVPLGWGSPETLLRIHYLSFLLWALMAALAWRGPGFNAKAARRGALLMRISLLLILQAMVFPAYSTLYSFLPVNLWYYASIPVVLMIVSMSMIVREARILVFR